MTTNTLLKVIDLKKSYLLQKCSLNAVNHLSFEINSGETLGLVGESGCGKSTVGRLILRLEEPTHGKILFNNENVFDFNRKKIKSLRKEMQIILQDPYGSLNPRMTVLDTILEPLLIHKIAKGKEAKDRVEKLLELVGLKLSFMNRFPHELSGGQRQRVNIARTLAVDPSFIVCDEPTSALDVSVRAQIINLLRRLQDEVGLTYLFISHDLSVVKYISNRIAVMYLGEIVELAYSEKLYKSPLHPYTQALLSSIPIPDPVIECKRSRIVLKGELPPLTEPLSGCPFHTRCPYATKRCKEEKPLLKEVESNHFVKCHLFS